MATSASTILARGITVKSEGGCGALLSNEHGTYKTVKARFWPGFQMIAFYDISLSLRRGTATRASTNLARGTCIGARGIRLVRQAHRLLYHAIPASNPKHQTRGTCIKSQVSDRNVSGACGDTRIHGTCIGAGGIREQLLHRNVQRFRGGLVFKAHRLFGHSTLGLRVIKNKRKD